MFHKALKKFFFFKFVHSTAFNHYVILWFFFISCLTKCFHFKLSNWWLKLFLKLYETIVLEFLKSYFINKLYRYIYILLKSVHYKLKDSCKMYKFHYVNVLKKFSYLLFLFKLILDILKSIKDSNGKNYCCLKGDE